MSDIDPEPMWKKITNAVCRTFGSGTKILKKRSIEESLNQMLMEKSVIEDAHEEEKNILKNLGEFGTLEASDVMVHRADITAAPSTITFSELHKMFLEHEVSRMPVYNASIDDVVGFIHIKDMFRAISQKSKKLKPQELLRVALFVPQTIKVVDLLSKMRNSKTHMAIVMDEHGGTAGLVTFEDIVEELVGDVQDEYDEAENQEMIVKHGNGFIIEATAELEDVEAAVEVALADPNEDREYETIGGLVTTLLGYIPSVGQEITLESGVFIRILEATDRRIKKLYAELKKPSSGSFITHRD